MRTAARSADQVLVVAGASFDQRHRKANQVLATIDDRRTIKALVSSLGSDETDHAFMAPGGPSLVFLVERSPVAIATLLSGEFIRCEAFFNGGARITDPAAMKGLLLKAGVGLPSD